MQVSRWLHLWCLWLQQHWCDQEPKYLWIQKIWEAGGYGKQQSWGVSQLCWSFVSNLCHDPSSLQQLLDLDEFLKWISLEDFPDRFLLHHPIFLEDEEVADLYVEAHRLVRHEFPTRRQMTASDNILLDMESGYKNETCIRTCEKSVLFRHLLGGHGDVHRAASTKLGRRSPDGTVVVDMHRIAMCHTIEMSLLNKARARSTGASILLNTYSRKEVIQGVRYMFPLYPLYLVESFEGQKLWYKLNMLRRLPIPSIYRYVSPINMALAASSLL